MATDLKLENFCFGTIGVGGITNIQGEDTTFLVVPNTTSGTLPATGEFIIVIYTSSCSTPHQCAAREGIRIKSRSANTLTIKTRNVVGDGGQQAWLAGDKYILPITSEKIEELAINGANSDITSLTGLTTPLSIAQGGTANTQGTGQLNKGRFMIGATDFPGVTSSNTALPTWATQAILSGTNPVIAGEVNHPGIASLRSTTTANSGYGYVTSLTAFLLAGGETTELIFQWQSETTTTAKFGFQDVYTISAPVDGAWINMASKTLDGRTSSDSVSSTTGTSYTLVSNTWYRAKIVINSDATRVDYYLYNEAGTLLWTDYLTTNIPTATGRETGHGIFATDAGTTAVELVYLDYMNLYIDRVLVR